ncbi:tyrosine-type recombinase/integrase [Knoellia sp. p5-6-4]|uniref:tyrosine-type recombinase/integrase n=1 Tax=unclassified Knoellia TaxID=2618719 RepID=UPI0023DBB9BA|nr:tyrosine-type recombinase/integrase [Knoellia sp. p5-6-4]MDF2145084.1 tyrosine-type recombinase/integrase [Knoellia sp. p5-6-4]
MSPRSRTRHNGEGSIFPYAYGYRAYVWITTPEGRRQRKYVQAKTREETLEKWKGLQRAAERGPVAPKTPTLAVFMADWLQTVVRPNLAPTTVKNYEMFTRLYVEPDLGRRRLDKLTVRDVQTWVNALRTRCQCCAQGKDAARPAPRCCAKGRCCQQVAKEWTVRQAWTILRSALSAAQREELITRNVAGLVRMPVPRTDKPTIWSVEQVRQFLESAHRDEDPLLAGYVLMLVLGLRRGELLGMAWDDIDFERGEARIAWQLQRVGGQLMRRRTKTTSSEAVLPLPDICIGALRDRQELEGKWRADAAEAWQRSGLVLTTRYGMPVDPRNFHRMFKERAAKAGVPVIAVHSARRTCASLLVAMNVHPRVAMAILRHSQIAVTMDIYSQVSTESARQALLQLGSALGEGQK